MSKELKISILLFIITGLLYFNKGTAQVILWDDVNKMGDFWNYTLDTLFYRYGIDIDSVSIIGWSNIFNMDAVWINAPEDSYSTAMQELLIEYVSEGGRVVIGEWRECGWHVGHNCDVMNTLLMNPNWNSTLEITDTIPLAGIGCHYYFNIFNFSFLTTGVCSVGIGSGEKIDCGNNAYPIILSDSTYEASVSAISYPFLDVGNCTSFVMIYADGEQLDSNVVFMNAADYFQYTVNLLLAAVNYPGYELEPCAIPEPFMIQVDSYPNCVNPGDTITLTGNNLWQGSNENIGGDIEIYIGDTVLIPIEYSDYALNCSTLTNTWLKFICPELHGGNYSIQLGHKAILFDGGEILIPCESPQASCLAHPLPFSPNNDGINDYCKFEYPGMPEDKGVVSIFKLDNTLVREVRNGDVRYSSKGTIYWDGRDSEGNVVNNGVYVYVIEADGRIVCNGTVYVVK